MSGIHALDAIDYNEGQLEALFRRCPTMGIDTLVNKGGAPTIDIAAQTIRNDRYWKGFFPQGHVLNAMSSAIFTGFRKEFFAQNGKYSGITSDTDDRIHARNSLEEIEIGHDTKGTLEPGRYILLRYLDPPWQGFYDIFKIVNDDLLIGRVYLGEFPNGARVFTFPMSRVYSFDQMTADDHAALYAAGTAPAPADVEGVWRMDTDLQREPRRRNRVPAVQQQARRALRGALRIDGPDGRNGGPELPEGPLPVERLHAVPRRNPQGDADDFLVGTYMTALPPALASLLGSSSLGLFHTQANGQFGFYYTLTRMTEKDLSTSPLLSSFLDAQLPDGVGMTVRRADEGLVFPRHVHAGRGARWRSHHRRTNSGDGRSRGRILLRLRRANDGRATSTSLSTGMRTKRRSRAR